LTSDDKERREAMDIIRSLVTSIDVIRKRGEGKSSCMSAAPWQNFSTCQIGVPANRLTL